MKTRRWCGMSFLLACFTASAPAQTNVSQPIPLAVPTAAATAAPKPVPPAPTAPAPAEAAPAEDPPAPEKWGAPLPEDVKLFENLFGCSGCGEWLKDQRLRVYGWLDAGYTYSSNGSGPLTVEPRENRFGNEFLGNQAAIVIERQLKTDELSFGFNATFYAGADASLLQPKGGLDDPPSDPRFSYDFRQLYVSAHLPILTEGGVDVKAGRMGTIIGYNSALAPYRPFYSSDYQWFYSQDGAWTGALTNWHVNKQLDILSGVTLGANTFFTKRSDDSYCYIGQVNYWLTEEKKTLLSSSFHIGEDAIFAAPGIASGTDKVVEARVQQSWCKYLDQIVQSDVTWGRRDASGAKGGSYGLYNIFSFHLCKELDVNLRGEGYLDNKGLRTGFDANYAEATFGFDYHPCKFIRFRPEVRGDFADKDVFSNGTKPDQLTIAMDVLFQF
jgi:Putative beta-barrel porin-2, OmpL-like. bbp2